MLLVTIFSLLFALVTAKLYFWTKLQECERSCSCNNCWRQRKELYASVSIISLFPSLSPPLELQANVAQGLQFPRLLKLIYRHIVTLFGWKSNLTPDIYLYGRTQNREQRHKLLFPEVELTKGSQCSRNRNIHTLDCMATDLHTAAATEPKFDPRTK
jgi:hypothetical protein